MQAVVNAAHAKAKQEEEGRRDRGASVEQSARSHRSGFAPDGGTKSSNGVRPKLTIPFRGRLSDEDADYATDELPRLTASGAIASPGIADATAAPPHHIAPPGQAAKPGRGDHAAKRDRRAERRERLAQADRERAARADRERAAGEEAERERARKAELAAYAEQVVRDRERAAREQAEQEAAARAERERTQQAEREQAERDRAAREQAEREQTEREQAERDRAARDRAARERERAAYERAAQAQRERAERAERERAERERAELAERERAERERAERAERDKADSERAERGEREQAESEPEKAARAEREKAERERQNAAEAEREWAEWERAAMGERSPRPALSGPDHTTQLIAATTEGTASTNGAAQADGAVKPGIAADSDDAAEPHAAAGADVLEYPRRAGHQAPARHRSRIIALIAAAAVVVAAGPVAIMMFRHSAAPPDGSGTALRNEAAAWIAQQVSPSDVVSCDLAMCQTLEANGVSTGNLLVMNSADQNVLGSEIVVSTAAIRQLFGGRLDSVYAPTTLACFGSGRAEIEVRVVAQHGSAAYLSQLDTDVQQRKNIGTALSANHRMILPAAARRQMLAGQVDSRLLLAFTLFLATSASNLNVLGFGDAGPGASSGMPLRAVYLAETGAVANVRSALAGLRDQPPAYRPARAETVRFDGQQALYIEFAAPPALGLIS